MKHLFSRDDVLLLAERAESSKNIIIVTHTNPDGDAIGSVTAMGKFLSNIGLSHQIWTPNRYPDNLSFLDTSSKINIYRNGKIRGDFSTEDSDLVICMDFNQLNRSDDLEPFIRESGAYKILIDHHPDPERESFDLIFSAPSASSTCECVYNIIETLCDLKGSYRNCFDKSVADSLYVGLMTDTNNFSNSVTPETFITAARLIEKGVDKELLQHKVFGVFSEERMRLLGHVLLNKMVVIPELEAAYIVLTQEEQQQFKFREGDSEGFVNMPLNINKINISALFTESDEYVRVSLRSVNHFSVNRFSRKFFNGGGHERAAGGRLYLPIDEVGRFFEEKLKVFIETNYLTNEQDL